LKWRQIKKGFCRAGRADEFDLSERSSITGKGDCFSTYVKAPEIQSHVHVYFPMIGEVLSASPAVHGSVVRTNPCKFSNQACNVLINAVFLTKSRIRNFDKKFSRVSNTGDD
jgi:hypothetical protein